MIMNLDDYAIQQLAPYMTGHTEHGANFTGRELISIFNKYGSFRDVYANGFHQLRKEQPQQKKHTLRTELKRMNGNEALSSLIEEVISKATLKEKCAEEINDIISACGYNIENNDGSFKITGLRICKTPIIKNTAVFQKIQNDILQTLDKAQISIVVAVAWFTNDVLYKKFNRKEKSRS